MSGLRRRRWPNIKPTLGQHLVFTMIQAILMYQNIDQRIHGIFNTSKKLNNDDAGSDCHLVNGQVNIAFI